MSKFRVPQGIQGRRSIGGGRVAVGSVFIGHLSGLKSRKAETAGNMPPPPGHVNAQTCRDTPHILR
jgi:hypothetical protein